MFTENQHRRTGHILQVIHNQLVDVAINIRNSVPANTTLYQRTLLLCPLPSSESSPLKVLRIILDNEVHREISDRGPLKIYFKACQLDFKCPDLLMGVPDQFARNYQTKKKTRDYFKGKGKPRLDLEEIKAISHFLDFCKNKITGVGKDVSNHYGGSHPAVTAALSTVRALQNLSFSIAEINPREVVTP